MLVHCNIFLRAIQSVTHKPIFYLSITFSHLHFLNSSVTLVNVTLIQTKSVYYLTSNYSTFTLQTFRREETLSREQNCVLYRGELCYLAPLGSENISAPYFKQCFFQGGGGITPHTVKHHASQSQDRNNKYFILYIEFCINNKI